MHIIITLAAIVILFTGIFFSRRVSVSKDVQKESEKVLAVSQEKDLSPTAVFKPAPMVSPTLFLTPTPKNLQIKEITILSYQYPNSQILSFSSGALTLKSHDSVDSITEWYKNKIKNEGMNVKTFVATKTNDKIESVLVGSNYETQIRVEIKKDPSDSNVTILVTKSSSRS